ncbi:unnamed protein product [Meganyctiphanes norvegica]|uniref:Ion transport domain-containing protein n=1 Tax=Meganyctiphanes norvegica TaxID=48144 RepID=A0AAV2RJB1_MEGNR
MSGQRRTGFRTVVLQDGEDTPVLRKGAPDPRFVAFIDALDEGDLDLVRIQLQRGLSPNHCEPARNYRTPLLYAVKHDFVEVVEELIGAGANVNTADAAGVTPLHMAAAGGQVATAELLLAHGANPDPTDKQKRSPLHYATRAAHSEISEDCEDITGVVKILLDVGALRGRKDAEGRTALHNAASAGSSTVIRILGKSKGAAMINSKDNEGRSPLHSAVQGARSLDAVSTLLQLNASIDMPDNQGLTALHMTSARPVNYVDEDFDSACIELLLAHGASVTATNQDGHNALSLALKRTMWWGRSSPRDYVLRAVQLLVAKGSCIQDGFAMWRMVESFPSLVHTALNRSIRANTSSRDSPLFKLDVDFGPLFVDSQKLKDVQRQSPLIPQSATELPSSLMAGYEVSMVHYILSAGRKNILKHPLCNAFLHYKWLKVRKYFLANMFFFFLFVISLTAFLLATPNCKKLSQISTNSSWGIFILGESTTNTSKQTTCTQCLWNTDNTGLIGLSWVCLVIFISLLFLREIVQIVHSPSKYFVFFDNYIDAALVICVPLLLIGGCVETIGEKKGCCLPLWQQSVGSISLIFAWVRFMLFTGQFPSTGVYVLMFTTVAKNVLKFLLMYLFILIAFALGFFVLLRSEESPFTNPAMAFLTSLVMMTGELDYESTFLSSKHPLVIYFILIGFILLVYIILSNLLVGLAVSDMSAIQQRSEVLRLSRQVELMVQMEGLFHSRLIPHWLQTHFLNTFSITKGLPFMTNFEVYPNRSMGMTDAIYLGLTNILGSQKLFTKVFEIFVSGFIAPQPDLPLPQTLQEEMVTVALQEHEFDKQERLQQLRAVQVGQQKRSATNSVKNPQYHIQMPTTVGRGRARESWRWTIISDPEDTCDNPFTDLANINSSAHETHNSLRARISSIGGPLNQTIESLHMHMDEICSVVQQLQSSVDSLANTFQKHIKIQLPSEPPIRAGSLKSRLRSHGSSEPQHSTRFSKLTTLYSSQPSISNAVTTTDRSNSVKVMPVSYRNAQQELFSTAQKPPIQSTQSINIENIIYTTAGTASDIGTSVTSNPLLEEDPEDSSESKV